MFSSLKVFKEIFPKTFNWRLWIASIVLGILNFIAFLVLVILGITFFIFLVYIYLILKAYLPTVLLGLVFVFLFLLLFLGAAWLLNIVFYSTITVFAMKILKQEEPEIEKGLSDAFNFVKPRIKTVFLTNIFSMFIILLLFLIIFVPAVLISYNNFQQISTSEGFQKIMNSLREADSFELILAGLLKIVGEYGWVFMPIFYALLIFLFPGFLLSPFIGLLFPFALFHGKSTKETIKFVFNHAKNNYFANLKILFLFSIIFAVFQGLSIAINFLQYFDTSSALLLLTIDLLLGLWIGVFQYLFTAKLYLYNLELIKHS